MQAPISPHLENIFVYSLGVPAVRFRVCTWLDAGSLRAVKLLNLFFTFHVPRNKGNTRADANYPYIELAALIHVGFMWKFKTFVQTTKSSLNVVGEENRGIPCVLQDGILKKHLPLKRFTFDLLRYQSQNRC